MSEGDCAPFPPSLARPGVGDGLAVVVIDEAFATLPLPDGEMGDVREHVERLASEVRWRVLR